MKYFLIILGIIIVFGVSIFLFFQLNKTYPSSPQSHQSPSPSPLWQRGDINHDGHVDSIDKIIIKKNLGCQNNNPCWEKVIGKTDEGDNPIYVSDLDLNNDGVINNKDMEIIH